MSELRDTVERDAAAISARGFFWNACARSVRNNVIAEIAVQGLRISGMVLLARVLRPEDFGLLRVLLVVSVFATLLCESGIPDALIQRRDLTREHEVTGWWLNLGLALFGALALYAAAPTIARLMAMRGLTFGIRLMCIPLFLEGTAVSAVARLSRSLKFGVLATADVFAEVAFLCAAFVLVWRGQPEWSLAGGLSARLAAHALALWIVDSRIPWGMPSGAAARDLGRFAVSVLGGRLVTVSSGNADFLLVGRLLGGGALGLYSMAWDLLRFVPDRLHRVAGRVAMPAFCQLQDNNDELARAYCGFLAYIARVVLPIAGCVALAAPELLTSLYGPQWLPAATPMRVLATGLALVGLRIGIGSVYYAKDYPSFDIYLNGTRLFLIVLTVVGTAQLGLIWVSAAVSSVEFVISIIGQYLVCVLVKLKPHALLVPVLSSLRVTTYCLAATAAGKTFAFVGDIHGAAILWFVAIPPALVFCWCEGGEVSRLVGQAFAPRGAEALDLDPSQLEA